MTKNILFDEIRKLQREYRDILIKAKEDIFKTNSKNVIDEINCFWYQNRRTVKMILRNICNHGEGYIFTAATVLDISNFDHFKFVSIGKCHIWDDPICSYMNTLENISSNDIEERMKKEIVTTIDNNIRILDETDCKIIILPVRHIHENNEYICEMADKMFLDLFEGRIKNIDEYINSFVSIQDVYDVLGEYARNHIVFYNDENLSKDLIVRFFECKGKIPLPFPPKNDAHRFYMQVFSNLAQAIDVITLSYEYNMIPFVRNDVTSKYCIFFFWLPEFKNLLIRMMICYILYRTFDKEMFCNICFDDYCKGLEKYGFEEKILEKIGIENLEPHNFSIGEIRAIIDSHLEKLSSVLDESFGFFGR